MKKKLMTLVVCVVLSVTMVTPCLAATAGITKWTDGGGDGDEVYYGLDGKAYSSPAEQAAADAAYKAKASATVTTPATPATPTTATIVTPVATAPATATTPVVKADANTQAVALQVTYNFVVQQFYGGDHQKAFADLANYANLCNTMYPQVLQAVSALPSIPTIQ